jgi:serine O-acetyltransferase
MNKTTKADLYRYDGLTGFLGFLRGLTDNGFRYTYFLRKTMRYKLFSVRGIFFRVLKRLLTYRGYHISNEAQIGDGFSLYHRGTVYIGPIKIGKNCTISHNVTIGRSLKGGQIGRPTISDNVWIGTGAVVVGKINIGKDVLIAPNAFVNFDVPDHSIVIGNPGKIIKKENPTRYYITHTIDD